MDGHCRLQQTAVQEEEHASNAAMLEMQLKGDTAHFPAWGCDPAAPRALTGDLASATHDWHSFGLSVPVTAKEAFWLGGGPAEWAVQGRLSGQHSPCPLPGVHVYYPILNMLKEIIGRQMKEAQ